MWDYDKLFAENNVIGLKALHNDKIFVHGVSDKCHWGETNRVDWHNFKNKELKVSGFEIQYIIRLDEHGNVVEKLFDRETDMPNPIPKLEDGMFIRVLFGDNLSDQTLGFINLKRGQIVYQNGGYDFISNINYWIETKIVEIYAPEVMCFTSCKHSKPIWRSPDYQAYLDSKVNL